jgi:hypothetical protein
MKSSHPLWYNFLLLKVLWLFRVALESVRVCLLVKFTFCIYTMILNFVEYEIKSSIL